MSRLFILLTLLLSASVVNAAKPIELSLWENGAPTNNEIREAEYGSADTFIHAVSEPKLYVYPAEKPNGIAIIMCPGGSYAGLAMTQEGTSMAQWMNAQGITYAVLKYRMPNGHKEVPLDDAEQSIRLMREHANEWGIDTNLIGIMGASAGGHLAASLANLYHSKEVRPNFQILFYPVISMGAITHLESRDNLLGKGASQELKDSYSLEKRVTPDTPKAFILLSADDDIVDVSNSLIYTQSLIDNGISVSLHIYPTGGHGWGYNDGFKFKHEWTGELERWIREEILNN